MQPRRVPYRLPAPGRNATQRRRNRPSFRARCQGQRREVAVDRGGLLLPGACQLTRSCSFSFARGVGPTIQAAWPKGVGDPERPAIVSGAGALEEPLGRRSARAKVPVSPCPRATASSVAGVPDPRVAPTPRGPVADFGPSRRRWTGGKSATPRPSGASISCRTSEEHQASDRRGGIARQPTGLMSQPPGKRIAAHGRAARRGTHLVGPTGGGASGGRGQGAGPAIACPFHARTPSGPFRGPVSGRARKNNQLLTRMLSVVIAFSLCVPLPFET
jgi:hypothetical protein